MPIRFYIDADLLGLAKILVDARSDVTYPGDPGGLCRDSSVRPPCSILRVDTPDPVWLPIVAQSGWLILTKDKKIRKRPAEIGAVKTSNARVVALSGTASNSLWSQLELVVSNWQRFEAFALETGPFIYRMTSGGRVQRVPLQ